MSLNLHPRADLSNAQITDLEKAMTAFYKNPPPRYYQMADRKSAEYNESRQPYHCDLVGRVFPSATLLEAGCGTAHLCPHVEKKGGLYHGVDHSEELLADNRRRFPNARFFPVQSPPSQTFDIVASLYTLEHVADPPAYLKMLWNFCRPGGLIAIICPEFIDSPGYAPSIFFGHTPRRLREKLKTGAFADAAMHGIDLKLRARQWKKRAQKAAPGAFWINLAARALYEKDYDVDTDAVHLPRLLDLIWFYQTKGAEILQTSSAVKGVSLPVIQYNCYLLVRKPISTPPTA